jgi:cell division protein ZapA
MGQVAVNMNGRLYRFDCGDGEEARLEELAAYVKARIDALEQEYGNVGDDRLMLTAALLITDELMDARAVLAEMSKASERGARQDSAPPNAQPNGQSANQARAPAEIERREADPIRAEYRRKLAAGGDA